MLLPLIDEICSSLDCVYKKKSRFVMPIGYSAERRQNVKPLDPVISGALAGGLTRAIVQPFDVVKIRFQLQSNPIKNAPGSHYQGVLQAFRSIIKQEGVTALWKGHVPSQMLSIVSAGTRFPVFELLTWLAAKWSNGTSLKHPYKPFVHFVSGSCAGIIAAGVAQPFDVLRTRFVAQGRRRVYDSVPTAVRHMWKEGGWRTFYKGLSPRLIEIGPHAGLQFMFYAMYSAVFKKSTLAFERLLTGTETELQLSVLAKDIMASMQGFLCGSMAGMSAKIVIYPLDVCRKRLQISGFEHARQIEFGRTAAYTSLIGCIVGTVRHEGVSGLYKGLAASMVKASIAIALQFAFYETFMQVISDRRALLHPELTDPPSIKFPSQSI